MIESIKSPRGFAAMDPARQREIASRGGKMAHETGKAHEFSPDEARGAGRKGGLSISQNREHMAAIGREGGFARARKAKMLKEKSAEKSNVTPPSEANPIPRNVEDMAS